MKRKTNEAPPRRLARSLERRLQERTAVLYTRELEKWGRQNFRPHW